jgi:spore coat protein U-like protein
MTLARRSLSDGLYKDAARTQLWESSAGEQVTGSGAGTVQNLPVYGRIPPQATPPAGTYSDTVVVTVTY